MLFDVFTGDLSASFLTDVGLLSRDFFGESDLLGDVDFFLGEVLTVISGFTSCILSEDESRAGDFDLDLDFLLRVGDLDLAREAVFGLVAGETLRF